MAFPASVISLFIFPSKSSLDANIFPLFFNLFLLLSATLVYTFSKEVPRKRTKGTGKKGEFVVDKIERKGKAMGGPINEKVKKFLKEKPKKDNIKEKILPKKKKDRLEELRKELGLKKGGKAKFPDLTGDGKVTRADILKGRGVFRKGGATRPTGKVLEAIKQDYKKNKPPKGSKKPGRK